MKCNECEYAANYIDGSEVEKKQCEITGEVHESEFDCNCVNQRSIHELRNALDNYKETKQQKIAKLYGVAPDMNYVYNTMCEINKEIESNALSELIQYLEKYLDGSEQE